MTEGLGPLNLEDSDLKGFEAVDPGHYNAEVFEVKIDAVKNLDGTGKMPAGTPMIKFQFRATEDNPEGLENRRFFAQYIIPPADYDAGKAAKIKGMFARALISLGEPEEQVLGKGYEPDLQDFVGRPCVIVVGKEQKRIGGEPVEGEYNNPVKGVKPAGSTVSGSAGLL